MKHEDKKQLELYLAKLEKIRNHSAVNPFETLEVKQERIARAKADPEFFAKTYLPHYCNCDSALFQIELAKKVYKGKKIKALVRWGRGLAKSVWCDTIIPLWLWINDDINYMVLVANNFDKAKILLSDIQAEFEANDLLINDFGNQQMTGSWESGYFITKSGFIAKALGMGQSPRGLRYKQSRPDYIVADDLEDKDTVKNPMRQDEVVTWILQDLIPTMDTGRRRYLQPNNNFAPRTIQSEIEKRRPNWMIHQVNAYNPATYAPAWKAKYTAEHYRYIEQEEMGILAAQAEYNNKPHLSGKIFKNDQIQWKLLPNLNQFKIIVGHWDVAYSESSTADFNAVKIWGLKDSNFYNIHGFVKQCKMRDAIAYMLDFNRRLPDTVSIHWQFEAQFWNDEVFRTIKEVETQMHGNLYLVKIDGPKIKKYDRIVRLVPFYQNGRVFYNAELKGHNDTQTGIDQLMGIEPGYKTHDDSPDADEQAIATLEKHIRVHSFKPTLGKRSKSRIW